MQRNWIGRSEGARVTFRCAELGLDYEVFTTRPDTLFGATFFVIAPEHPDINRLAAGTEHEAEVHRYVNRALGESPQERGAAEKAKTGVPLGRSVTNPVTGEEIPIYVADYVLMEYGTGAVMGVPAHDQRDFEFARAYGLEIRQVIAPADGAEVPQDEAFIAHSDDERLVNSGAFDGMTAVEGKTSIMTWLREQGIGDATVNYRLRDWLISRQRYWGCPIPIVYCEDCGQVPVPEDQLPVVLPDVEDYQPRGRSPLAAAEDWVNTTCPSCGGPGRRETDTMDTFVDSSWYFLRYCDARNDIAAWDPDGTGEMDAGRSVHRRRRTRDPAPALRALLRQSAGRHGPAGHPGAVRGPVHAGDDPRSRRRQDVQVARQRDQPAADRRALRRRRSSLLRAVHRPA